jgi:hypothetical protein
MVETCFDVRTFPLERELVGPLCAESRAVSSVAIVAGGPYDPASSIGRPALSLHADWKLHSPFALSQWAAAAVPPPLSSTERCAVQHLPT